MPDIHVPTTDGFFDQFFPKEETPPEGYRTIDQLSIEYSCPRKTVQDRLDKLVRDGKMEKRQYMIKTQTGMKGIWHYGPPLSA